MKKIRHPYWLTAILFLCLPLIWTRAGLANEVDDLFQKGTESLREGKLAETIQSFTDVLNINNEYADAYNNRGNLHYNQDEFDAGIADYTKTIDFCEGSKDLKSNAADAHYNRGLCYYNKKSYDLALADYERVIALRPDFKWAYYSKGYTLFMKAQYDQALSAFQHVVTIDPNFDYAYFGLGLVYQRKGDQKHCISSLKTSCNLGNTGACNALKELGAR
jgi:tetratricopeptide (TPR) repeat protein